MNVVHHRSHGRQLRHHRREWRHEVVEARDGDASFANGTTEVTQGDVAQGDRRTRQHAEHRYVVIGNAEDDNYQANISITDDVDDDADDADGEVTIRSTPTQLVNNTSTSSKLKDDDDDADDLENEKHTIQTDVDNLLDTGDYEISVSGEPTTTRDGRLR